MKTWSSWLKKLGLNISQITEEALKSKLLPLLPKSERNLLEKRISMDFVEHLNNLKNQGMCYLLRIPIKRVKLKKIWKFDRANFSFTKGLNMIYDPEGTRKAIIINVILEALGHLKLSKFGEGSEVFREFFGFGFDDLFLSSELKSGEFIRFLQIRKWRRDGETRVELYKDELVMEYLKDDVRAEVKCVLLDEPASTFNEKLKKKFIKWLKKKYKCQIIMGTKDKGILKLADNVISFQNS
jgi:hypothetical protein